MDTTTEAATPSTTDAVSVDALPAAIRPYRRRHADDVRRIWRSTLQLGAPLPFPHRTLDRYERLCLDWYLDPDNHLAGRADAVVVEADGRVHGYALACLSGDHHAAWSRRAAVQWGVGELARLPFAPAAVRRFTRLRVADGLHAWRHGAPAPFDAHAHVNLDPDHRGAYVGHHLVGWMDRRVASAGLAGWIGEVNVPHGRSLRAIEDAGAQVVDRVPNRTLSWLQGTPVERCVIARPLAHRTDTVPV